MEAHTCVFAPAGTWHLPANLIKCYKKKFPKPDGWTRYCRDVASRSRGDVRSAGFNPEAVRVSLEISLLDRLVFALHAHHAPGWLPDIHTWHHRLVITSICRPPTPPHPPSISLWNSVPLFFIPLSVVRLILRLPLSVSHLWSGPLKTKHCLRLPLSGHFLAFYG